MKSLRGINANVVQTVTFDARVPATALGDETGVVNGTQLGHDPSVNTTLDDNSKCFAPRLDLTGATGLNESYGHGRPGNVAKAWFMIETSRKPWRPPPPSHGRPFVGGTPSFTTTRNTLFSITLAPGEPRSCLPISVPSTSDAGQQHNHANSLHGSGDDSLCESCLLTSTPRNSLLPQRIIDPCQTPACIGNWRVKCQQVEWFSGAWQAWRYCSKLTMDDGDLPSTVRA